MPSISFRAAQKLSHSLYITEYWVIYIDDDIIYELSKC